MTSEEARELLNRFTHTPTPFTYPIFDVVFKEVNTDIKLSQVNDPFTWNDYSFRELIKTAYNLKDND